MHAGDDIGHTDCARVAWRMKVKAACCALLMTLVLGACTVVDVASGQPTLPESIGSAAASLTVTPTPSATASPSGRPSPTPTPTATPVAFPSPIPNQSVYDLADVLTDATQAQLEEEIVTIRGRSGAEIVLYLVVDPDATGDSNLAAAQALMQQWEVGPTGYGLVILVAFEENRVHGQVTTYAGAAMLQVLDEGRQAQLRDEVMIPTFQSDGVEAGIVAGIQYVDEQIPGSSA